MARQTVGQDALLGQTLGHYRMVQKIGAGGMGEVYCARDQHLSRDVAIKVLPPGTLIDESARKHFRKEALILLQFNHPNITTIHDFDTQQGVKLLGWSTFPKSYSARSWLPGPCRRKKLSVRECSSQKACPDTGVYFQVYEHK